MRSSQTEAAAAATAEKGNGGGSLWSNLSTRTSILGGSLGGLLKRAASAAGDGILSMFSGQEVQVGSFVLEVHRKLADGGFSQVFLVSQQGEAGRRAFALKVMAAEEGSEEFEMMRREVEVHQMLTELQHTNLVPLLASSACRSEKAPGQLDVRMVFPYYKRKTLHHVLLAAESKWRQATRSGAPCKWPFQERGVPRIFVHICRGLAAMHKAGFAHRDLKPANVLLSDDRPTVPLLTDFGSVVTAKPIRVGSNKESQRLQEDAAAMSSAAYRAPELWDVPFPGFLTVKADIWSLGCLLYALAFGRSPYEPAIVGGIGTGVMRMAILSGSPEFPEDQRNVCGAQFSDPFCELIREMLHRNPKRRPTLKRVMSTALKIR